MSSALITIGEVFDHTFDIVKKHYPRALHLSLWLLVAALPLALARALSPLGADETLSAIDIAIFILRLIGSITLTLTGVWLVPALIAFANNATTGKIATAVEDGGLAARKRFWGALGLSIASAVFLLLLTLPSLLGLFLLLISNLASVSLPAWVSALGALLVFPGGLLPLYLLVRYSIPLTFAPYIFMLENERPIASIKKSIKLVEGRWWQTFGRVFLPSILYSLASIILSYLLLYTMVALALLSLQTLGASNLVTGLGSGLWTLTNIAISAAITPLMVITNLVIYRSLRDTK